MGRRLSSGGQPLNEPDFSKADWAPLKALDFGASRAVSHRPVEVSGWEKYTRFVTQYAASVSGEGTSRRITETPGLVFLALEEQNLRDGEA